MCVKIKPKIKDCVIMEVGKRRPGIGIELLLFVFQAVFYLPAFKISDLEHKFVILLLVFKDIPDVKIVEIYYIISISDLRLLGNLI